MRKILVVLVLWSAVALYAGEGDSQTFIRNVCDSLVTGSDPVVPLTAAYIDESNWYGDPHTWNTDSTSFKRHEDYSTLDVAADKFGYKLPLSVNAECRETRGNELTYVTRDNSKAWVVKSDDDIATYIFDIHAQKFGEYDSTNANNLLAIVPVMIPEDDVYESGQMLVSAPFELSFEWWFVGLSYKLVETVTKDEYSSTTTTHKFYGNAVSYDSLSAFRAAYAAISAKTPSIPDTLKTLRIQAVKVVLKDSRKKAEEPESSSGESVSSSSEPAQSSSSEPSLSSSSEVKASSSSATPASSGSGPAMSSAEAVVESSSESVSSSSEPAQLSSSSSKPVPSSSSEVKKSSSSEEPVPSSSESEASSSSVEPESSSSGKGVKPGSSSSEKIEAIAMRTNEKSRAEEVLQVRRLDGTLVKSSNLVPGVYYVRTSAGSWRKMAVLPK